MSISLAGLAALAGVRPGENRPAIWALIAPIVSAVAVLCAIPAMTVVLIGVLLMYADRSCPSSWAVPALLVAALFPLSSLAFLPLLPVLFRMWSSVPAVGADEDRWGMVLAAAWVWHQDGADPALVVAAVAVLGIGLAGVWVMSGRGLGADFCRFRPLLLLSITLIALRNGLQATAQAGALAFFLDLAMQVLLPLLQWRVSVLTVLRVPLPPMPGFVVLWLGVHVSLGLASGIQGWSIAGVGVAMLLGGFAFGDGLAGLAAGARGGRRWPVGMALLLCAGAVVAAPVGVALVCAPAIRRLGGAWLWSVFSLNGGDGAHLRLLAFCTTIVGMWLVLVRPWTPHGLRAIQVAGSLEFRNLKTVCTGLSGYRLPWAMRRLIVSGRGLVRQGRSVRFGRLAAGIVQGSVWFWLVLLGLVLAGVGLAS